VGRLPNTAPSLARICVRVFPVRDPEVDAIECYRIRVISCRDGLQSLTVHAELGNRAVIIICHPNAVPITHEIASVKPPASVRAAKAMPSVIPSWSIWRAGCTTMRMAAPIRFARSASELVSYGYYDRRQAQRRSGHLRLASASSAMRFPRRLGRSRAIWRSSALRHRPLAA
jgi:hypothetical protein